ncbi:MAG TPA: FG-GAP-like repeat-containing protein [Pyrinomonadaceae bacterium]|nr:FG-GAP-like repeat-containing protein [Pyrinomonadaceae bacterium]
MRTRNFSVAALAAFAILAFSFARPSAPSSAQGGDSAGAREEAYRANNLGVALLEQFKHREGAEQFRRALKLDPRLAAARINLAVALYNVPELDAALKEAEAAAALAPEAPQPHYLLGLIARQQNRPEDAVASFRRVLKIDPRDPGAQVNLGQLLAQQRKYEEAITALRAALAEEPYNGTALYNLGTSLLRAGQREEGQALMRRFQELRESGAATVVGANYLEQGRYAEAVTSTGAEAHLVSKEIPDVTFADATAGVMPAPAPPAASAAPTPRREPARSGEQYDVRAGVSTPGTQTLFDFDGDGDLDLFAAGRASQHLYRNDAGKFSDVTAQAGALGKGPTGAAALGAVAGDFDNDEKPDLFVVRPGSLALYRNEGGGRFADVTAAAKIPAPAHLSVAAALADLDHDGDLDIFLAGTLDLSHPAGGDRPAQPPDLTPAPNLLLRNNGDGTFADVSAAAKLGSSRAVAVVPTDYDNRRDVDLLVVNHGSAPQLFRNLRDGSFRDVAAEVGLGAAGPFTCAAAGDVNKDGFTDFFFGETSGAGLFALSDGRGRFQTSAAPAGVSDARAAQFLDYDNDGLLDLLAMSPAGLRVLRNMGGGWQDAGARAAGKGLVNGWTADGEAAHGSLSSGDLDGDGDVDFVARAPGGPLLVARNEGGNRLRSLRVRLAGKVSNRGGVGAKVEVRAGSLWQKLETYAAAPAPAPADLSVGLGRRERADAVRVIWPAGIVQAETEAAGAASAASGVIITELDRKPSSCPYLYAWNGERFEFVTDFLGGGELGYWVAPGVRAAPDPDEYVRIRGDQLKERDGRFELRVTNELEEALFVDRLQLVAVAHPANVEVYPNEGLGNPSSPDFRLYAARGARPPRAARDDHGHDVLARLREVDRAYPDDFRLHRLRGYADEHALELDLGDETRAAAKGEGGARARTPDQSSPVTHPSSLLLLLTGWTDYAFSSDNVAAAQQGLGLKPPALQVKDARGRWRTVIENIGVPVGRPQTVAVDLTGKFLSASREVRVVTNMRVYWDQALVAEAGRAPVELTRLDAATADLRWRGFSAEVTPDGREPFGYDYARVSARSPWKVMTGRYTREGDVRELLSAVDDIFVVSRTGDELSLSFDARGLAPLPEGWARTFLLYADGFSKEMDLNSASPDQVAPLPFHGMRDYPYAAPERYPATPERLAYIERYNTRVVTAPLAKVAAAGGND